MSLSTPTTQEVSDQILAQIEASMEETVPLLPKAFLRVLARVLGGVFLLLYKYAGYLLLQQFVAHASMRETVVNGKTIVPLVEWGRLFGIGDPTPATRAELLVEVAVDVLSGTLPAGSQLLFPATGVIYATVASVALDAATIQVTIRAVSDPDDGGGAGAIGNLQAGDVVSFASPLPNVQRDATVISQVVTGADAERESDYRTRIVRRVQRPPQGGAYSDYRIWGEEDPGIINVYPYTSANPGEVDVYVEATEASSGSADGIPTAAQLDAVRASINFDVEGLPSRRAANAAINVYPITRLSFDVDVSGLSVPAASGYSVADVESSITEALDEYLRSRAPYIVGLSLLPRTDLVSQAVVAGVVVDTATALGASVITVDLRRAGVAIPAYILDHGEKAKLGTPTFALA